MITITGIYFNEVENAGCNNGTYFRVNIVTTDGFILGKSCRCGKGCANTWATNRVKVGDTFLNLSELYDILEEKE